MIRGIEGVSFLDYPGLLSCVLFLGGCNYDCFYCHNRPLLEPGEEVLSLGEVESFLAERKGLLDALVVSGGEPTLHKEITSLFSIGKGLGYLTKLDTNGSRPEILKTLLEADLLDYVALDIKAPPERYREISGGSFLPVFESLNLLKRHREHKKTFSFEIRTTMAPTLGREDIEQLASIVGEVPRWVLNEYRVPRTFKEEDRDRVHQKYLCKDELQGLLPLHPALCLG